MATFTYDAKDETGASISGVIEAAEQRGAAAALREQGLWPTRLEPQRGYAPGGPVPPSPVDPFRRPDSIEPPAHRDIAPFLVSVPTSDLAQMYRQLATLLNAGVPVVQSLSTLAQQTSNGRLQGIIRECAGSVAAGNPLSTTMKGHSSVFSIFELEMVRAGEISGSMEVMCNRIATYLEREVDIRRKMKRETLYPKIVLTLAGAVLLLLGFLKSGAQGALGPLRFAIEVAIAGFGLWWLARYLNQYPAFGAAWDEFKMKLPGTGTVARKYATARFTRALGTLYAAGVLLPTAVRIAARACGNRAIGEHLLRGVGSLEAGHGLSGMLAESGMLSPIAIQMARTGEQTGNLDTMMEKVSDYLESEADQLSHQLAKFAGVAALLLAAVVVAYIVITFYVGQLSQTMQAGSEG
jgi:type IV pilus assembly protein PilC